MPLLFVACAVAMTLAALAFVLLPLTRRRSAGGDERLRALDAVRAAGVLDGEEYARKRAALPPAPAASPRTAQDFDFIYDLRGAVDAHERAILEHALGRHRYNQRQTAKALGLSYDQLRHCLKKHGLLEKGD